MLLYCLIQHLRWQFQEIIWVKLIASDIWLFAGNLSGNRTIVHSWDRWPGNTALTVTFTNIMDFKQCWNVSSSTSVQMQNKQKSLIWIYSFFACSPFKNLLHHALSFQGQLCQEFVPDCLSSKYWSWLHSYIGNVFGHIDWEFWVRLGLVSRLSPLRLVNFSEFLVESRTS